MGKDYNISKFLGQCSVCGKEVAPGGELVATVCEGDEEFQRCDYCCECWESSPADGAEVLGVWRTRVRSPREKKKLFVDNEMLMNLFCRLAEATEGQKVNFRFVLALVLMRKKLLVYDHMEKSADGTEIWMMHFKGSDEVHTVIDPHMDEDKIAAVSENLGQILEADL